MSIASAIFAEQAEAKRKEWLAALEAAYAASDWSAVQELIVQMRRFYFSE